MNERPQISIRGPRTRQQEWEEDRRRIEAALTTLAEITVKDFRNLGMDYDCEEVARETIGGWWVDEGFQGRLTQHLEGM